MLGVGTLTTGVVELTVYLPPPYLRRIHDA